MTHSQLLGRSSPRLIYVESFARVSRPSLSARLVRPMVDRLVVQWRPLADRLNARPSPWLARAEHPGFLV